MALDPDTATNLPGWLGWLVGAGGLIGQWFINRLNRAKAGAESQAEISSYKADSAVTDAAA